VDEAVTTGDVRRLPRLDGSTLGIDPDEYHRRDTDRIQIQAVQGEPAGVPV